MENAHDRDQRTEDATPNRIRKAREEGQIGFSSELGAGVMLLTAVGLVWLFGQTALQSIGNMIGHRITEFEECIVDPRMIIRAMISDTTAVGLICMAFILPLGIIAAASGLLQTGFNLSFKPIQPDINKLSIKSGFSKIFSSRSVVRGGLSIIKATMILCLVYWIAKSKIGLIAIAGAGSFPSLMGSLGEILLHASMVLSGLLFFVGVVDLAYQKWKHLQDIKMSIQEIKDEHKDVEGDPLIKARIKRLQAEVRRKRALENVPEADVVVTNPTHFAVALKYDRQAMDAPVVVAKGADFMAKKIIKVAKEHGVAVVERKPVARYLYANVEIGQMIPLELYTAVAEILNFVHRLRQHAA